MAALDTKWFEALRQIHGPRPVQALLPRVDRYRQTSWSLERLETVATQLHALEERLAAEENNRLLQQIYAAVIREQLIKTELLQAALQGEGERFRQANQKLYGTINADLWRTCVSYLDDRLCSDSLQKETSQSDELHQHFTNLVGLAHPVPLVERLPSQEVFKELRQEYLRLPEVARLDGAIPHGLHTVAEIVVMCRELVAPLGYKVVWRDAAVFRMRVAHNRRLVIILGPASAKLKSLRVKGLLCHHEIGIHVLRRVTAEKSPILLLQSGLDLFERGEEGLGVTAELMVHSHLNSALASRRVFALVLRYYISGLIAGQGGAAYKDTQVTTAHLESLFLAWLSMSPKRSDADQNALIARQQTAVMMASLLRGMGHNTQGIYFGRPAVYLPSMISVMATLSRKEMTWPALLYGHFDPNRTLHQEAVAYAQAHLLE